MYIALDPLPNKSWLCKHETIVQDSSICRLQTLSIWTRSVLSSLVNSLKHYIFMKCYRTLINIKPNILCTYPWTIYQINTGCVTLKSVKRFCHNLFHTNNSWRFSFRIVIVCKSFQFEQDQIF